MGEHYELGLKKLNRGRAGKNVFGSNGTSSSSMGERTTFFDLLGEAGPGVRQTTLAPKREKKAEFQKGPRAKRSEAFNMKGRAGTSCKGVRREKEKIGGPRGKTL